MLTGRIVSRSLVSVIDQQIALKWIIKSFPPPNCPETLPSWLYDYMCRLIYVRGTLFTTVTVTMGANLLVSPGMMTGKYTRQLYVLGFILTAAYCIPYAYAMRLRNALRDRKVKSAEVFAAMSAFA